MKDLTKFYNIVNQSTWHESFLNQCPVPDKKQWTAEGFL